MTLSPALFLILAFAGAIHAATISETFSSRAAFASGTAVWNQALGKIHPTLQVVNYKAGFTPIEVDIGDGSHGVFDISTYANFSVGGDLSGNKIRFDTDAYPVLQVTSFHLAQGWVLEPVGDNPLIIYSLGDVTVEGDIWCHGEDGGDATGSTHGLGGAGRCGGGRGGDGGDFGQAAGGDGESTHASVTGGIGGQLNATAVCGGGGGSWNTTSAPTNGANSASGGGDGGTSFADPEFLTIAGGAGGGGGSPSTAGGGVSGAGGGGGGGVIIIHAGRHFNLGAAPASVFGTISVNGGNGGSSNVAGGAGGGGGGGSAKVFAGGTINMYNTDGLGAAQANNGLGGTNSLAHNGGNGGLGRNWFASNVYSGGGFYTPSEQAPVNVLPSLGIVQYNPAAQNVVSRAFDLAGTFSRVEGLSTTPVSAGFQLEAAGSTDNFAADDTGFTTDLASLAGKRYIKFRITVTATDLDTPDMVDTLTIQYALDRRDEFNLKAAGCGRVDAPPPPGNGFFCGLIFVFLLALKFKAQRQKSVGA